MQINIRSPILSGLLLMLFIVLIGSIVVSLVIQFTEVSESRMPLLTYIVNAVSLLSGGFVAGIKAKERGWFYGGMTGVIYILILTLIAYLAFDLVLTFKTLVTMISSFAISAIGGIFGVNFAR